MDKAKTEKNRIREYNEWKRFIDELKAKASYDDFERIQEQESETEDQKKELEKILKEVGIDDNRINSDIKDLEAESVDKKKNRVHYLSI